MLKRKIETCLADWKRSEDRKPLVIKGIRQCGKTYIVQKFARENYESVVYMNFILEPDNKSAFTGNIDVDTIILNLSALIQGSRFIEGKTCIILDEIQECKEARTALKSFHIDGRFDVIATGSLLGVKGYGQSKKKKEDVGQDSVPVGYETVIDMYPLDFEEFIKASGVKTETIDYLKKCFLERSPVTDVINNKMLTHLKRYLVIGGMPAAVSTYVETGNVGEVSIIQDNIIRQYKVDFTKYETEDKKLMLTAIFDQIPSQLLRQNKRFNYSDIQKKLRFEKLEDSFLWLKYAGVAIATINATEPRIALSQNAKSSLIKLYSSDVGLLTYQYGNALRAKVLFGEEKINLGGVYENFVAQELNAHGYPSYFYNNHNLGELDFVIEHEGSVLPIEVKSGKDYYVHSAISKAAYNDEYQVKEAYVFANCNIEVRDKIVYYPIYMCAFVSDEFEYPVLSLDI